MFENSVKRLVMSGNTIKRPDNWGGYIVKADYFEFWQGGTGRSHDRFSYTITEGSDSKNWDISGLYP
jgi:pyridoxamine 5'-phosphate oxidase